jgi:hypothetical protein
LGGVAASWAAREADEQPEQNEPNNQPDDFAERSPAHDPKPSLAPLSVVAAGLEVQREGQP